MTTQLPKGPYAIYQVTSLDTGKRLIGYTGDFLKRVYYYLLDSFENGKTTKSGFYDDFRKYGMHRFLFEVIEDDIQTKHEAEDRELFHIAQGVNKGELLYNGEGTTRQGYPPHARSNPYIVMSPPVKGSWKHRASSKEYVRLTGKDRQLVVFLSREGFTQCAIATLLNVCQSTINRILGMSGQRRKDRLTA